MTNDKVSIEKRFELFEGYIKTVLNLCTGALVLSVTFLHDILGLGSAQQSRPARSGGLLASSWLAFLVSIVASLFYLYFLAIAAKYERAYSSQLRWGAVFSVFGFVAGLVLLSAFAWLNLP